MRILIVNPNTSAAMTRKIDDAAKAAARPRTEIITCNPTDGPESIEGYYDEAFSVPGLIAEIVAQPDVDAVVVACFDDSGLDAARCLAAAPVLGIGEAAFHFAGLLANRFSVVTTLRRSVPAIERNLANYGLAAKCGRVRACEIPVLDLEGNGKESHTKISAEIERAVAEDGAEAIVLGCAGMTDLTEALAAQHSLPVLDGVACAIALAEGLVSLGLKTSRIGGYAKPRGKRYAGDLAKFSPDEDD